MARARSSSRRPLKRWLPTKLKKGRRPMGCHLPTLPPRCVTPRGAAPARQVPGRGRVGGASEEPGGRGREPRAPGCASLRRAPGRYEWPRTEHCRPLWGVGSGGWTNYIFFRAQMPSPGVISRLNIRCENCRQA